MWISTLIEYGEEVKMGKLNVKVKRDIDAKFREEVFRRKGMKKGNLTDAIEEAMILWINVSPKSDQKKKKSKV
jgi:hypothetical protein